MINFILSVSLTLGVYTLALWIYRKSKISFLNPVLVSDIIIIALIQLTPLKYSLYKAGLPLFGQLLSFAVIVLAVPLYNCRKTLKENLIPILGGVLVGIGTCFLSIYGLVKLFGLDEIILKSVLAKSITTPMAIEATKMLQGMASLTTISVIITGIIGASFGPGITHFFKIHHPMAKGIGIGSAAHALGTARAVEMSEEVAAASGAAMALTGILTVITISIGSSFFL